MDEWTFITRVGSIVALVLGVAKTSEILSAARRGHRERLQAKEAERQLALVITELRDAGRQALVVAKRFDDELRLGVELGINRGVLTRFWRDGVMVLTLSRDPPSEEFPPNVFR